MSAVKFYVVKKIKSKVWAVAGLGGEINCLASADEAVGILQMDLGTVMNPSGIRTTYANVVNQKNFGGFLPEYFEKEFSKSELEIGRAKRYWDYYQRMQKTWEDFKHMWPEEAALISGEV